MRYALIILFLCGLFVLSCESKMLDVISACHSDNLTAYDSCINQHAEDIGPKLCEHVDSSVRDTCYLHAALGRNSERICKKIGDKRIEANCYGSLALYNGRLDVLPSIEQEDRRNEWYTTVALRTNNTDVCRKITEDPQAHSSCLFQLAKRFHDPDICYFIDSNTIYKDACYFHMAVHYRDVRFCVGVHGRILKNKCDQESIRIEELIPTGNFLLVVDKEFKEIKFIKPLS